MSLESRVKSLEEWRDHIALALMYAPKPEEPKGVVVNLNDLQWEPMPATETNKGAWEKALKTDKPPYPFIKAAIEAKDGKPAYMEGYVVWLNRDDSLGRRKK